MLNITDNEQSLQTNNKNNNDNVPRCSLSLDTGHQAWGNPLRGDIAVFAAKLSGSGTPGDDVW